jgi:hypothetical protein
MNALALAIADSEFAAADELEDDIALSELALEALIIRGERLHDSNIEHDPLSCLTCFAQR